MLTKVISARYVQDIRAIRYAAVTLMEKDPDMTAFRLPTRFEGLSYDDVVALLFDLRWKFEQYNTIMQITDKPRIAVFSDGIGGLPVAVQFMTQTGERPFIESNIQRIVQKLADNVVYLKIMSWLDLLDGNTLYVYDSAKRKGSYSVGQSITAEKLLEVEVSDLLLQIIKDLKQHNVSEFHFE